MKNSVKFQEKLFSLAFVLLPFAFIPDIVRLKVLRVMVILIVTLFTVEIGNKINIFYSMCLMFGVLLTMWLNEQDSGA